MPITPTQHIQLLSTYLFLIPIVVLFLCECTKLIVSSIRKGHIDFNSFLHAGGFPSTHSAFVTSLLIVVWRKAGVDSVEFAIAMVFAALVWYDSMSSRREIGELAAGMNRLQHWQHFQTRVGHSAIEVIGGVAFGALVTWVGIWVGT